MLSASSNKTFHFSKSSLFPPHHRRPLEREITPGLGLGSGLGLGLGSGLFGLANYTYQQSFPNDSPLNVYNSSYFVLSSITLLVVSYGVALRRNIFFNYVE